LSELTVATINLRNHKNRWLERRHLLLSALFDLEPDLVGFQEISLLIRQGRWLLKQLNSRLKGTSKRPYQLIQMRRSHPSYWTMGIGILTRMPVLYHEGLSLGYGGRVALRVNVELPSHQTLDFVCTHFHHVAEDYQARLEQAMALLGWLSGKHHVPLQLLAGDFNELPDGPAVQYIKQSFRSAFSAVHGHEPLATYPTALVRPFRDRSGCLDYVFLSPAVYRVEKAFLFCNRPAESDDTLYPSDHVGVAAKLEV
jgi:endonuclease/exonuclease/phosphatase family metal-dependent hydrolase